MDKTPHENANIIRNLMVPESKCFVGLLATISLFIMPLFLEFYQMKTLNYASEILEKIHFNASENNTIKKTWKNQVNPILDENILGINNSQTQANTNKDVYSARFSYHGVKIRNFLVSKPHKLLYCWIHKVASTTFTSLFSKLAGRNVKEKYYREIKHLSVKNKEELEKIIEDVSFTKLIVVRHPFNRLVSAYRDRLQDNSRFTTQAWKFAPHILARRRMNYSEIFEYGNGLKLKAVPSFQEFIIWLLSIPPSTYDAHWKRYHDQCATQLISYNVIIKLESLEDKYLLKKIYRLKKFIYLLKHLQTSAGGQTTYTISCKYFKDLDIDQIKALYDIYKMDFKIFNYSPEPFYKCAKTKV